ncbi:deoxyuridine 5'-triphosphate nucleotidohydrolase-like [Pseudorca crassidens]|uniref:deoxyuridine 5'-triphosphate nucleotidohydrolase-like n=1 Tax=Pseudorca crassidens TaxID=82174 RepID=UPI00352E83AA
MHATSGSAAVDLIAPRDCILTPAGVHKLATGVYGPIPAGTVGLLLGRSSLTLQGVTVHTGVTDEDYNGEISIMISVTKPTEFNKGQRIAQLLLLPCIKQAAAPCRAARMRPGCGPGEPGFCTQSGLVWVGRSRSRRVLRLYAESSDPERGERLRSCEAGPCVSSSSRSGRG